MIRLRRFSLLIFFGLAFLLPWLIWGTTILQIRGLLNFHVPQPLAFWVGLNIATYLSAWISGGTPAIRDLISKILRWRVGGIWYVCALVLTGLISLISIAIHKFLGGTYQIGVILSLQDLLPSFLFQVFFFLLTEETAWRGFALPYLQTKFSTLTSSLLLGLLWGLWHFPLILIPGSFQSSVPFGGFIFSAVAMSVLITWIYTNSSGSVFVAAIFHAATDVTIAYSNVMTGDQRLFWIFITIQCLTAFMVIILFGKELFIRKDRIAGVSLNRSS